MNTIILVGPPDWHKGPLCLCKSSDCSRRSQYVLQSLSASVLPCNDGLDTHVAPCPLYEGKDQDGKCRFVSFFKPVAITSTQASSVGVTVRYRASSSAIASNRIHALHKNNIIITMPTCDILLRHFCKMSFTVSICSCTLSSLIYSRQELLLPEKAAAAYAGSGLCTRCIAS